MTGETVLMYNCSGPEWAKLRQIFLMLRVRIRQVAPEQYGLTLEELLSRSEESRPVEESFLEPMLVFCGFAVLSVAVSILLKKADRRYGYGLELPNIQK